MVPKLTLKTVWTVAILLLKIGTTLFLAVVVLTPGDVPGNSQSVLARLSSVYQRGSVRDEVRSEIREDQVLTNAATIRSLEHRVDVLEAMRIEASLAQVKATIEFDHSLLMAMAPVIILSMIGSVWSTIKFKIRKENGSDES